MLRTLFTFSFIFFFCFSLFGCATTIDLATIAPGIKSLDNSVQEMKHIVVANKDKLSEEEYKELERAYEEWENVLEELNHSGCGITHIGTDVCSLSLYQVENMHKRLVNAFRIVYDIGQKKYDLMTPSEKNAMGKFYHGVLEMDKAVSEFEADPNSEKALNVLKAVSVFAKATKIVLPIVMGAI